MEWESVKGLLADKDYSVAAKELNILLERPKVNFDELKDIFCLENKLIIGDFLERYENFTSKDLEFIQDHINNNLNHTNKMYVSDLIDFASNWGLEITYEECVKLLNNTKEENKYAVSSAITYIYENFRFAYFNEVFNSFEKILKSQNYFQSCQVKVCFALFRITHHKKYLFRLVDLIKSGQELNKTLMNNILKDEFNKGKYFLIPDELREII